MNTLALTSLALIGALSLVSGCTAGHKDHDESENHHSDDNSSKAHGHGDDGDEHHDSNIGEPGKLESVDRTINVLMDDTMRFIPDVFDVVAGETIQFTIKNNGQVAHEFVLGSASSIKEHHEMMQKFPGMEHDEPNSVSLDSGKKGVVTWKFSKSGTVDIACLKAGHFEAGMKGLVTVSN